MSDKNHHSAAKTKPLKELYQQSTVIRVLGKVVINTKAKKVSFKSIQVLLLIVYLTELRKPVSRKALAELFWPERNSTQGPKLLSNLLSRANKVLPQYLHSYKDSNGNSLVSLKDVNFPNKSIYLDSLEFNSLIQENDIASLEQASVLYKGDFLAGIEIKSDSPALEQWLEQSRSDYQERYINLLYKLIALAYNSKDYEKALTHLQDLLILKPFDDGLQRQALDLYSKLNNKLGLVNHYNYLAKRISEEFGATVDSELTAYYQMLLKTVGYSTNIQGKKLVNYDAIPLPYYEKFIGRQKELANLKQLLQQERFVSLIGMPGIGKSTILVELLRTLETEEVFQDGILVIPQELNTGFDLLDYLAIQFGLSDEQAGRQDLLNYLEDKELLLAFDSTTSLQDEYHLLADLIRKTSALKIIVTSLEPIGLACEVISHLQGLDFPKETTLFQDTLTTSTAELFLLQAKKVSPNFELDTDSFNDFHTLCHLSQGSPLIIAIAASWIDILPIKEITANLLDLEYQHKDVQPRHKSIVSIFESLWELQNPLNIQHYNPHTKSNDAITLQASDLQAFMETNIMHPLYSQYCARKEA